MKCAVDVLASIPDGFVAVDNEWRFAYLNAAAARMLNRKAEELIGKTLSDALNIDLNNSFQVKYADSKERGEPVAFTAYSQIVAAWLEVRGYPHPDGYTIFFRDVSKEWSDPGASRTSERKLEAARSVNRRLFETSLDLIVIMDRQGNFLRVSPSSAAILGYEPEEMIGHSAAEFLHPDDLENTRREVRLARRGGRTRNFETRYRHKEGRIVTLAWTGVWSEPDQQHFFIGRDMTERIAAEERLRRAQRLEAIGQLTGGIAHDFNNLLGVIIGNLELLQEKVSGQAELAELAQTAHGSALRGADLTRQLLAFARKQSLQPKVIDLNTLLPRMEAILRRTLGENIELAVSSQPDLWPTHADAAQVETAILNLAINARQAMPKGGKLLIETANAVLDRHYAAKNADATPGEYVMLAVTDSGTGMTQEVLSRAFEPFFTTKAAGTGSGLGLSMIYGFVQQSGGHAKIYSEADHGTSVKLYLPRARAAAAASAEPATEQRELRRGTESVLIVEDNAEVRKTAVKLLTGYGYRVSEAQDGKAALAMIESGAPIDLLFTDVVMPQGMSGFDLARAALKRRPKLKVLFTSGYSETFLKNGNPLAKRSRLLSKPYRRQDLAEAVRRLLDEEPAT